MQVKTTKVSREITRSALKLHKALAQGTIASCKRLQVSEAGALEALGANDFLEAKIVDTIGDEVEITESAAKHWRAALGLWAKIALKRDEQCQLLALATNTVKQEKEAQGLLDQLQEQLGLELISMDQLVKTGDVEKASKPAAENDPESDEQTDETDAEFGATGARAPHRGPRPPRTAGKATREFTKRRGGK